MLHFIHQLVAYFVCVPFGGEQVAQSGFIRVFGWKQLPAVSGNDSNDSSENKQ